MRNVQGEGADSVQCVQPRGERIEFRWLDRCLRTVRLLPVLGVVFVGLLPTISRAWCYYDPELKNNVCAPPTVSITAPAQGAIVGTAPASPTLSATAAGGDGGIITKVEFYSGATLLGTVTAAPYNYVWSNRPAGSYTVTAVAYDTGPTGAGIAQSTTSAPVTFSVSLPNVSPSVALTAPASGAVYSTAPAAIVLNASASDSDGTISKIEFYNGTTLLGTDTASPYTWTWNSVPAGTYSLKARAYDNKGATTDSSVATVRVNAAPTVSLTSPAAGAVVNAPGPVSLAAAAHDGDGSISQVRFYANGALLGNGTLSGSSYTFSWSGVAAGAYLLTAQATDSNGAVTTSAPVSVTVNALPTTSLTSPANGTVYANAPASVALAANASDSDGSISKVEFWSGGTLLGTDTAAPYAFTWNAVPAGSYSLTARAFDNRGAMSNSLPISVRVNTAPTVSIASPTNGSNVSALMTATLSAAAADIDGSVAQVQFYADTILLGTATKSGSSYIYAWQNVPLGSHSLTAKATDNDGVVTTSTAVNVNATTAPVIGISTPANGALFNGVPATITLTASATDSGGTITKVEYFNGAASIGSASAPPYTVAWAGVPSGTYSVTARATDNHAASTTSSPVSVVVNALPAVSLASSTSAAQAPASFTLSATASDPDGTIAKVEFYNGAALVGAVATAPFAFTWTNVGAGTYSVTAHAYDNRNATANSAALTLVVGSAAQAVAVTPPNLTGAVAGSLSGSASVTPGGASHYTIPLVVPPGTAGLAPTVSLDYSSEAGMSLLGNGWSIGGLSAITRCGKTIVQDGVRTVVNLTAQDQFCLDGQRLLLVSGTQGATAEYRTQVDAFSQVLASGSSAAKGPDQFVVKTKTGLIYTYGASTDATVLAQGNTSVVLSWALQKVEDRYHNYTTYSYSQNSTTGEFYPTRIRYTGNSAGLVPYNAVNFVYETRPDPWTGYTAGAQQVRTKRLTALQTRINTAADGSGGTLVRDYRIAYTTNATSGISLVSTIADCDGAGICLPSTRFDWTTWASSGKTRYATGSGDWGGPAVVFNTDYAHFGDRPTQVTTQVIAGDFDGDGATDLARWVSAGVWQVCLSAMTSFSCSNGPGPDGSSLSGDFTGSGRTQIASHPSLPFPGGPANWSICTFNRGSGFVCAAWAGRVTGLPPSSYLIADVDGDGRNDIIMSSGGNDYVCRSVGNGFARDAQGNACAPYAGAADFLTFDVEPGAYYRVFNLAGDFFGDGRSGVDKFGFAIRHTTETDMNGGLRGPGKSAGTPTGGFSVGASLAADHNNDGYADYASPVIKPDGTLGTQICSSTGTGMMCEAIAGAEVVPGGVAHMADYDGDGRPDVYAGGGNVCELGESPPYQYGSSFSGTANYVCEVWATGPDNGDLTRAGWLSGDFNGDGRIDFAEYYDDTKHWTISLHGDGGTSSLLAAVTDGVGEQTQFSYDGLDNPAVYTKGADVAYPKRNLTQGQQVVSELRVSNAQGGWLATDYKYEALRTDLQGRGALGFAKVTAIDKVNGITAATNYSQDFPTIGMTTSSSSTQTNNVVLSATSHTLASFATSAGAVYPYIKSSTITTKDLDGTAISTVVSQITTIDGYGNATATSTTTTMADGDVYTTSSASQFDNLTTLWCIGLARKHSIAKTAPGAASVARTVGIDYDPNSCQTLHEIVEPDDTTLAYKVTSTIGRDATYGVVTSRTTAWRDPASNTDKSRLDKQTPYDAKWRYPLTITNAKGHSETRSYDEGSGHLLTLTGPNQLTTTWHYDGWGRQTREDRADGTATTWAYRQCVNTCLNSAKTVAITQHWADTAQTTVPEETFADSLGRTVATRTWGFAGTAILSERVYDASARLDHTSRPYYAGASPIWSYLKHDAVGRITQLQTPNDAGNGSDTTLTDYHGQRVTTTNAKSQGRTEVHNGLGQLKSATDANGKTTSYLYDGYSNLLRTTDPAGNQVNVTYDRLGRKTQLADPDLGTWTYKLDPLGQPWKQTNAKSQVSTYDHDELGRITHRLESDLESFWVYDSASKGVGKLAEAYTWAGGAKDYRRIHTYDAVGRPAAITTSLDADYVQAHSYDSFGRQNWTDYRRYAKAGTSGPATSVHEQYNAYGYLSSVNGYNDTSTYPIWSALAEDAEGHVTKAQLGNGAKLNKGYNANTGRLKTIQSGPDDATPSLQDDTYSYDSLGNLTSRTQLVATGGASLMELFGYDNLNRLTSSQIGSTVKSLTYDTNGLGNIASKTNVGTYAYTSGHPHALSAITGTVAGITNPSLTYDANGNLQSGLGRSYGWTSYNQAATIDKLSGAVATQRTAFLFDTEHQRTRETQSPMSAGVPGAPTRTIYTAGAIEKEIDTVANTTTIRTYLPMALGFVEEKIAGANAAPTASGTRTARYFLTDHLGSPIAVLDQARTVLQRMGYDAWGRRRNPDGSDDSWASLGSIAGGQDHTGFTGQEQLDTLGLVHLNGRVYDPLSARFTSADPTVPDPTDLQSLNRFSYVLNNPLAFTDPSGLQELETLDRPVDFPQPEMPTQTVTITATAIAPPAVMVTAPNLVLAPLPLIPIVSMPQQQSLLRLARAIADQAASAGRGAKEIVAALKAKALKGELGPNAQKMAAILDKIDAMLAQVGADQGQDGAGVGANSASLPPGGPDDDGDAEPKRVTNPKHHPNSKSPEPKNVDTLYENSVADKNGVRWAKDADGTVHRFSKPSNGETHWNGSTGGVDPIQPQNIPVEIRRLFGVKG